MQWQKTKTDTQNSKCKLEKPMYKATVYRIQMNVVFFQKALSHASRNNAPQKLNQDLWKAVANSKQCS